MRLGLLILTAVAVWQSGHAASASVIDFEDLGLAPNSYQNHFAPDGFFSSGGAKFNNFYDDFFDSWEGWAYSNQANQTDGSWSNQYSAFDKHADGTNTFAVTFSSTYNMPDARIELPAGLQPVSADLTNVTYAALTMRDGDSFSRKFGTPPEGAEGVADGEWPDWFKVIITGRDSTDQFIGTVEFYLADYRNIDGAPNYIVDEWTTVDLTSLAGAQYLVFSHEGSDVGEWGLNTPAYVALDNLVLTAIPEPSTFVLSALGVAGVLLARRRRTV